MSDSGESLFEQAKRIKEKLNRLKTIDKSFQKFGAFKHKYELNAPLKEDIISAFEDECNITLPKEYRLFLKHLGNGGAGPFYGVAPLQDSLYADMDYKKEIDKVNPGLPFPHTEPQIMYPEGFDANAEDFDEDAFYEQWNDSKHTQGILRLCNYGCGVFIDLVVNGEEYGNMWTSDIGNDAGIFPSGMLENEPERITFLDWYELWLDESLKESNL